MQHESSQQTASDVLTAGSGLGCIVTSDDILGGEPVVRGTRVPVRSIVQQHRIDPSIDDLLRAFPMLSRADVEAALSYYDGHRAEIDRYVAENEFDD